MNGTVKLPFSNTPMPLWELINKLDNPARTRYMVKSPSTWWERFRGKHVIGTITHMECVGEWIWVTTELTHPERFDTNCKFELWVNLKEDRIEVLQSANP